MGRLLSDAIRLETGADVGLLNRGGIRAAIPRGPITPRIVYTAIPFEEDLYLLELTGAELLEILETGMQGRRRDMEISGFTCRRNQLSPTEKDRGAHGERRTLIGRSICSGNHRISCQECGYGIMLEHEASYAGISLLEAVTSHISRVSPSNRTTP